MVLAIINIILATLKNVYDDDDDESRSDTVKDLLLYILVKPRMAPYFLSITVPSEYTDECPFCERFVQ